MMSASETIRKVRIYSHLDMDEFAKEVGINRSSISRYEKGSQKPRMSVIRKIMDIAKKNNIEVSIEDFLD